MLLTLGRHRMVKTAFTPILALDFMASQTIPAPWSFTRSSANATYRDSGGELRVVSGNNTPRFDYTIDGTYLGLLVEGQRTNRCTNYNAVPAATTNVSVTGTATVTLVTDASALATARIGNVVTGNVFQVAGGASGGTAVIAGGTSSTGSTSVSLWARDVTSTGASFGITPSPAAKAISGAAYQRYVMENLNSTATTDTMVITIPAGVTINFILNQMERTSTASSPIIIAGASATRAYEYLKDTAVNTRGYWTGATAEGAILVDYTYDNLNNFSAVFAYLSDNNDGISGDINSVGHAAGTSRSKTESQYNYYGPTPTSPFGGNFDQLTIDKAGKGPTARFTAGVSWKQGVGVTLYANPNFKKSSGTLGAWTREPDRLYIGSNVFSRATFGYIRKVMLFKKSPSSFAQVGPYLMLEGDRAALCSGQSNMDGWFSNSAGYTNGGEKTGVATIDAYWTATRNFIVNGSTSGTLVRDYGVGPANTWINLDTGVRGTPFLRWLEIASGLRKAGVKFLIDTAGESDAGNSTKAQYKAAQLEKFRIMQEALGHMTAGEYIPIMLVNLGRESSGNYAGYQIIAEAGIELARDYPYIHYVERIDITKSGTVHIDDAGCQRLARRVVRKAMKVLGESVSGGVDGPRITGVSRSGTAVTVTIAHDAGATDFTPSSGIVGFHFFDSNTETSEIAITSAVRTNATTITLTLASTPGSANQELIYGWRSLQPEDASIPANLVLDNSAETLPLRRARWTSTNTGASFSSAF